VWSVQDKKYVQELGAFGNFAISPDSRFIAVSRRYRCSSVAIFQQMAALSSPEINISPSVENARDRTASSLDSRRVAFCSPVDAFQSVRLPDHVPTATISLSRENATQDG
jgi:hypothetical protein